MAIPRLPKKLRPPPSHEGAGTWPPVEPELLKALSPATVLKNVVLALGYKRARDWLREYGGVNFYIPVGNTPVMGLAPDETVRLRIALYEHTHDAGRVCLPKSDKLLALARNTSIRRDAGKQSIRQQAHLYDLCGRQILNIRRESEDVRQFDLF